MTIIDGETPKSAGSRDILLVLSVMAATIIQVLDTTVANVALPHMQSSLSAGADTIVWALTSYVVGTAIILPCVGWMTGKWGQRAVLLGSVVGFILASALCGAAQTLTEMILYRTMQGAMGAPLIPVSLSIMLDSLPKAKHASALGIWGAGLMVGPLAGPVLGGWLTENLNWRWVFLLNVPIGVPALIGCWLTIPRLPHVERRLDRFGYATLAAGLIALQLMMDRGERQDWFDSTEVILEAAVALCCGWMFVVHTVTGDRPLYPRVLFRNFTFMIATVITFVVGVTMYASMALTPPMLQTLYGYPVTFAGLVLAPRGAGTMVSMLLMGRIVHRLDPRLCAMSGLAMVAWANYETAHYSLDVSWQYFATVGAVQGLGIGFISVPMNLLAFSTLPGEYRSDATSYYALVRNMGSAIGISAVTTLLSRNAQISHSDIVSAMPPQSLWPDLPVDGMAGLAMLNREVSRQATMIAYLDDFYLLALAAIVVAPLLLLARRPRKSADEEVEPVAIE